MHRFLLLAITAAVFLAIPAVAQAEVGLFDDDSFDVPARTIDIDFVWVKYNEKADRLILKVLIFNAQKFKQFSKKNFVYAIIHAGGVTHAIGLNSFKNKKPTPFHRAGDHYRELTDIRVKWVKGKGLAISIPMANLGNPSEVRVAASLQNGRIPYRSDRAPNAPGSTYTYQITDSLPPEPTGPEDNGDFTIEFGQSPDHSLQALIEQIDESDWLEYLVRTLNDTYALPTDITVIVDDDLEGPLYQPSARTIQMPTEFLELTIELFDGRYYEKITTRVRSRPLPGCSSMRPGTPSLTFSTSR